LFYFLFRSNAHPVVCQQILWIPRIHIYKVLSNVSVVLSARACVCASYVF
jgi:hypothetical protein